MIKFAWGSFLLVWIAFLLAFIKCRPSAIPDLEEPDNELKGNDNGSDLFQALKDLMLSKENITSHLKEFTIQQDTLMAMADSPVLTIFFESFPQLKPYEGTIRQTAKDLIKMLS